MTIIAYQGISGSNSELAAKQFAEEANISSPIFLPCATSAVVIEAMTKSQAAYGVIGISQLNWRK
jgi:prephenate dehydratase